ncbi:GntR family transcriptional regulator [Klebsiella sp. BIGb0407]|uniref:GntR family transcriptional regulator n=1 Tax=Klebsiella sp. BIGb0407 TaxID=2940603 RepID=UPI00216747B6|nr:GntR family transcriptional regulator [Klebsiella sp. BIGb0407]MCS3433498.1 DNA-binding GntR family transcriptional regulator [Klebsiella sp. BIGb0407]
MNYSKLQETQSGQIQQDGLSASRRIYLYLRQQIIEMSMPPGMRVIEREIAEAHGISRTPVHEAVQRLAEDGLIEIRPRVGTFVARIPLDALEEAMLIRTALEQTVVAEAAKRSTTEGINLLHDIINTQNICAQAGDTKGFHQADEAFHVQLGIISGHPGIWPIILQAKIQIDRYRQLTLPLPGRMTVVVDEHISIVNAVASHNADEAISAMRQHLDQVLPVLKITNVMHPEYFIPHPHE